MCECVCVSLMLDVRSNVEKIETGEFGERGKEKEKKKRKRKKIAIRV